MYDALFQDSALEQDARIGSRRNLVIARTRRGGMVPLTRWRDALARRGVHIVLAVDRQNMIVESELSMEDDIERLIVRSDPIFERRMREHTDAAADELIELAETAVRPHR